MRERTRILSRYVIGEIEKELRKMHEEYYVIFKILLETGMPLENIPSLLVSDISGDKIVYAPSHKNVTRCECISVQLQKEIKDYVKDMGKSSHDLAFTALKSPEHIFPLRNFQNALTRASENIALEQPVTALSIRKTYIYGLYIKTHDIFEVYSRTNCRSVRDVMDYFCLDIPEPKGDYLSARDIKFPEDYTTKVQTVNEHFSRTFNDTKQSLCDCHNMPQIYYNELDHLLNSIESALERFDVATSDPDILFNIYSETIGRNINE